MNIDKMMNEAINKLLPESEKKKIENLVDDGVEYVIVKHRELAKVGFLIFVDSDGVKVIKEKQVTLRF